ncbi:MAG TPA: protein kinase [Candidatus Paceibacterota bacterium]|nr:protein kinase [Candidatus Paceibacterota bacterium]
MYLFEVKVIGKLSQTASHFVTAEIVNILEYMHEIGIAHRDLKPGNFLLDDHYHLKLIDFGTSKIEEKGVFNGMRRPSMCIEMDENEESTDLNSIMKEEEK